jgi:acetoin utilization deacetylase AcuC-like enzyme
MATGFVWHERYMWHNTGRQAGMSWADAAGWLEPDVRQAENVETKRRFRNLLEVSGLLDSLVTIRPRPATVEEVCRFHTREYVARIQRESARYGGDASGLDSDVAPFGRGSYEVALLSAGGVIEAIDAVLDGRIANAYVLNRPPGHHAVADRGSGFCIFGNLVIGALHARQTRGLDRVAIVDWDVHHGNGTQAAFYADPSVLTISLHQDNYFPPDSGHVHENGEGAGTGYNVNIPLPPGTANGGYVSAFERVVVPALERFRPDLIVIASGFDASTMDPLGRMMVSPSGYAQMTRLVMDAADRLCGGRLVIGHEGGYSPELVPFCGLAVLETLSGIQTEVRDTMVQAFSEALGGQEVQPHQAAAIAAAAALVARIG